jgi:hypothetical protein
MNSNATYASTGLFDRLRRLKARFPLLGGLVLWVRYIVAWALGLGIVGWTCVLVAW